MAGVQGTAPASQTGQSAPAKGVAAAVAASPTSPTTVCGACASASANMWTAASAPQATAATGSVNTRVAAPQGASIPRAEPEPKDDQLQALKDLRRTGGLWSVPVGDALRRLRRALVGGKLSKDEFLSAYGDLLTSCSAEATSTGARQAVFEQLDWDGDGLIFTPDLVVLALLCTGSEDERLRAIFGLFDEDGDGFIGIEEMFRFLTSVFRVLLTSQVCSGLSTLGAAVDGPEEIAAVASLECFRTAGQEKDGRLTLGDLKDWFFAPHSDPPALASGVRRLLTA